MKKIVQKIALIIIIATLYIIINNIKVQAASVSLTASTKEPTEGQSVTVTANVTAGAWNLKLSGAGKSETVYGYTQSASNASDSKSITFNAGTAGTTYTFSLTGDMTDINSNNSEPVNESINITVKAKETESSGNSGNSDTPTTTTKSTEARLSNFGITPNDFSGFKKDTYNYKHEVPNSVSEVTVYAEKADSKATVTGTGKVSLQEGNNTVNVTVTAEAGNTKTYTLTIKRRTAEEDAALTAQTTANADLKSLGIKPEEYDFSGFQKDITEYVAEVPSEVDEIEVYAEASNSKAQVNGIGKISLKEGKNEIKVEVIAEDGTTKTYTIEVTRGESNTTATTTSKFGLSKLTISGLTLNPNFKVGTYEYTVELNEDLTLLDIEAIATDENANIEIAGNENLKEGENIITILVSDKETNETATYQITVNKNLSSQPETMSWLRPSTWGKEEIIKLIIIAVLVLLIISAIILKIKISKEGKQEKDVDLPGADELDKAMAEHQELSEYSEDVEEESNSEEVIENENTTEDLKVDTNSNYLEEIAQKNGIEFTENNNNKAKRKGKHF